MALWVDNTFSVLCFSSFILLNNKKIVSMELWREFFLWTPLFKMVGTWDLLFSLSWDLGLCLLVWLFSYCIGIPFKMYKNCIYTYLLFNTSLSQNWLHACLLIKYTALVFSSFRLSKLVEDEASEALLKFELRSVDRR